MQWPKEGQTIQWPNEGEQTNCCLMQSRTLHVLIMNYDYMVMSK
jgi:hypothetical protein